MILKARDEHTMGAYISQLGASKRNVSFWNKSWSEDLKMFYSYTSLEHTMNAYFLPLLSFSSVMATFEIFSQQKLGVEKYSHTQFRS